MTDERIKNLMKQAIIEVMTGDRKIEIEVDHNCPYSSDDIVFFKRLKRSIDTVASWIGHGVILAIISGVCYVIKLGLDAYKGGAGG